MVPNIVFVGAGPVGLWTAIQIKLRNPALDIRMHEKYQEYKRKHLLKLNKKSFANAATNESLLAMINGLATSVRTTELENGLKQIAHELGIEIVFGAVDNCEELAANYPETPLFIDASGSHSITRTQIFDDAKQTEKNLQYIAEMKYEALGNAQAQSFLKTLGAQSYTPFLANEAVGRVSPDGQTPVSIRFFIDEETYTQMQDATFKNPYTLDNLNDMPKRMAEAVEARLILRERYEQRIENSEKITVTTLPVYAAAQFTKHSHGKDWCLVGDAALGVPYFRSLNAGLEAGTQLALCVADYFKPKGDNELAQRATAASFSKRNPSAMFMPEKAATPLEQYEKYMQKKASKEINDAEWKNVGVNMAEFSAASSYQTGVSRSKVDAGTRARLNENTQSSRKISCSVM